VLNQSGGNGQEIVLAREGSSGTPWPLIAADFYRCRTGSGPGPDREAEKS
jgi:hypothetical protein